MRNLSRILQFLAVLAVCAFVTPGALWAASYSYSPDTVTFSPTTNGQDSVVSYVRIAYTGDTSGPGTYVHGWISSSSSYFSVSTDTLHITTHSYLRIVYHVQTSAVSGLLSISDDTVTHTVVLIGHTAPPAPDGELMSEGPYFNGTIPEGADTCNHLRLINSGSDYDTIVSAGWSHDPNGIFTWDSATLPHIMAPHDTVYWNFCFHAPNNTTQYIDTFTVHYHDSSSQTRSIWRFVMGQATDTTPPDGALRAIGPYYPSNVPEGADTCMSHTTNDLWPLELINNGSDVDTIESIRWTHDPGSIFSWDSSGTTFPFTLSAHDTMYWTACFHAPNDTEAHWDTLIIRYHDAYSNDRYVSRIVYGKAVDTSIKTCYGLYAAAAPVTNYGDTSYIHLFIHNYLDSSANLSAIHISGTDDGAFRVDSSNFPLTVPAKAYDSLWFKFIPNRKSGSTEYAATATLSLSSNDTAHCHDATVSLVGYMPQSCSDTESVSFDTTGTKDVAVTGDSNQYYAHRIDFVNGSSTNVVVSAVAWTHSSNHFLIAQVVPPLPDTLAPSGSMAVIIHFYGDSSGTIYDDTLALTVHGSITDPTGKISTLSATGGVFYVHVKGTSLIIQAGVTPVAAAQAPELLIYPNPSSGIVNMELEGASNATFEILDVLGHVIAVHSGPANWQWDASSLGLSKDGTYFIRATTGNQVTTKRLVLQ